MAFPYATDLLNALFGTRWDLPIPTFGLLVMASILSASALARREVQRQEAAGRLPDGTHRLVADLTVVTAVAGIIGARAFHIIDHWDLFLADPWAMIATRGGFSIYGGLGSGIASGAWWLRARAVPLPPMLDSVAPAMMLGYAMGRLGCQLAGDGDWGIAADMTLKPIWLPDWLWAQTYDGNIVGIVIPAPGVYPTPLYEAAAALGLFGVLSLLRSAAHRPGFLFSAYLLLAGFERLLIEKIRINPEHYWFDTPLTQAELISVLVVVAGLLGVLLTLGHRRYWTKAFFSLSVVAALSACVPTGATDEPVPGQLSTEPVASSEATAGTSLADTAKPAPPSPSPPFAEPEEIERQIAQFFAEQPALAIVSLSSIECGATRCEVALAGTEVNPRFADAYSGIFSRLLGTGRADFRILSGGLGTREIAPGAREYVMSFEYQPFVDLSADPGIAARQYAACAAAWRRQTENPTPTDIARQYREEAERYVALAASVLGEAEAERVATETRGGPLIRECRL